MKRRILLIEDDDDCRESVAELLRTFGHDIVEAASAADALELVATVRPDVIVMDLGLPGADGWELAKALVAGDGDRPLLVALTGWGRAEDRSRAADAGFDVFLLKPCDPAELETAVLREAAERASQGPRGRN